MYTFIGIIIVLCVLFVIAAISGASSMKRVNAWLLSEGYTADGKVNMGKYIAGHPDLDAPIHPCCIYSKNGTLFLFEDKPLDNPILRAEINLLQIKNISVEDKSTMEKKVTLGRFLAVGLFALAWQKDTKNEMAFVLIDWSDGQFDHETLFEYSTKNAMELANTARNMLMRCVKNNEQS
jgi:hypothetical protein